MEGVWIDAVAVPLDESNIDTGTIFPSRFLKTPRGGGYQDALFRDRRYDAAGLEIADFPLNHAGYSKAGVLVTRANFGCGSSRENAVFALLDYGIRCVIAPSFGEIFLLNAIRNRLLPAIVDDGSVGALIGNLKGSPGSKLKVHLKAQRIAAEGGESYRFEIDLLHKRRLMQPHDDLQRATRKIGAIAEFEAQYLAEFPWLKR